MRTSTTVLTVGGEEYQCTSVVFNSTGGVVGPRMSPKEREKQLRDKRTAARKDKAKKRAFKKARKPGTK